MDGSVWLALQTSHFDGHKIDFTHDTDTALKVTAQ